MKNTLITILAVAILGMAASAFIQGRPSSPHLFTAVEGSINTMASSSGFLIKEHRRATVGPNLAALNSISTQVAGRPCFNDKDDYLLEMGSDAVRVTVDHTLGKAASIKISPPSKHAEALSAGLSAAFPGLDCQIEGS